MNSQGLRPEFSSESHQVLVCIQYSVLVVLTDGTCDCDGVV